MLSCLEAQHGSKVHVSAPARTRVAAFSSSDGFLQQVLAYTALQCLCHWHSRPPFAVVLVKAGMWLRQPPLLTVCDVRIVADCTGTWSACSPRCHASSRQQLGHSRSNCRQTLHTALVQDWACMSGLADVMKGDCCELPPRCGACQGTTAVPGTCRKNNQTTTPVDVCTGDARWVGNTSSRL